MSSSIDKEFGNLYIFGVYNDGYVDLSFSKTQDTIIQHIRKEEAEDIIKRWDSLLSKAEELHQALANRDKEV
jgi:hypothetical protein